ncbi:immunoglobulin superfamily member 1-like [Cetorhinus maximus]
MIILSFLLGIINAYMLAEQGICADLPKPTLSVNPPFSVFLAREEIILTCGCQCPVTRAHYYRNKGPDHVFYSDAKDGFCQPSRILDAQQSREGNYTCSCLNNDNRIWITSEMSKPIQISIRDQPLAAKISMVPSSAAVSIGGQVKVHCQGEIRSNGGTFTLHRRRTDSPVQTLKVSGTNRAAIFTIDIQNERSGGIYFCRYRTEILGRILCSPISEDAEITVQVTEQKGTGTAFPLIAVLGCAAAIILAIFVAVTVFLFARRRKTKRLNIERCTASASGMANQQDGDLVGVNQSGSSNPEMNGLYSEVLENDNEEITYASLNMEALSRNKAASTSAPGANLPAEKKPSELAKSEHEDVTYAPMRFDSGKPQ